MNTTDPLFLDEFPPADYETWRSGVEQELRGASFDKTLCHRLADGFEMQPLDCEATAPTGGDPSSFPGVFPFTRGTALPRRGMGWWLGSEIADPDDASAREALEADLALGAELLWLRIGETSGGGTPGLGWRDGASLDALLAGVEPGYLRLVLDAGAAAVPAAALFLAWARRSGTDLRALRGSFGVDPLGTLASTGRLQGDLAANWRDLAELTSFCLDEAPEMRAALVSTACWHRAGATPAYELALGLCAGIETLRALDGLGIAPEKAANQILFAHELGSEIFLEIAKLRAFRLLWSKALAASGALDVAAGQQQVAISSSIATTRVDPWVNLLRSTSQAFAAAVGGAEGLVLRPWDLPLGRPEGLARRFALTSQYVLAEESSLRRVADPAGGSFSLEKLTEGLARRAWAIAQDIERGGGLSAALAAGRVQRDLAALAATRRRSIAQRKNQLVGTSAFPLLGEERPARAPLVAEAPTEKAGGSGPRRPLSFRARLAAAAAGASRLELTASGEDGVRGTPLALFRPAEEFEALRLAADAAASAGRGRPRIFFANLGNPAESRARAEFGAGLFPVAGIEVVEQGSFADAEALAAAFAASGCRVAVLNSTDEIYAASGAAAARALKAAGATKLLLAGRPGELEAILRAAGVDDFVYLGADMVALLGDLLRHLEVLS